MKKQYFCSHSVYPSAWPVKACGKCREVQPNATHPVTPEPAPPVVFSFPREANAWRRQQDTNARHHQHVGIFLSVDGVEKSCPSVAAGVKAFLVANVGEVRVVLLHRVWIGAEKHDSKNARGVTETVLQETACARFGEVL